MLFEYQEAKILEKWDSHRSSPELEGEGYFVTQDEHYRVVELLESEIERLENELKKYTGLKLLKHKTNPGWIACEAKPGWYNIFSHNFKKQLYSLVELDFSQWEEFK